MINKIISFIELPIDISSVFLTRDTSCGGNDNPPHDVLKPCCIRLFLKALNYMTLDTRILRYLSFQRPSFDV